MCNTPVLDSIVDEIHRRADKEWAADGYDFTVTITAEEYEELCQEEEQAQKGERVYKNLYLQAMEGNHQLTGECERLRAELDHSIVERKKVCELRDALEVHVDRCHHVMDKINSGRFLTSSDVRGIALITKKKPETSLKHIKRDVAYELAAKWPSTSVFHGRLKELGDKYLEKKGE